MREELTSLEDSRDTATVVAAVVAAVFAAIYFVSRIGFANPVAPILNTLGVSLFLITAPQWLSKVVDRDRRWWTSQPAMALVCLVIVTLAGIVSGATGFTSILLFAIAGTVLTLAKLVRWMKRGSVLKALGFVAGAAIFGAWCAGVMWTSRYKMPLFWETLAYKANIHHDTFYYASMANMLETYGVPSTGLDGIPVIHYHFGSPWLYAQLSQLIGIDVLTFYSLGYPLIVLPLFLSALLQLSVEIGAKLRQSKAGWLILLAATAGFLPSGGLYAVGVWNSNAFISESYLIGLAVMFIVLGCGLLFWRREGMKGISAWLFLLGFAPLMIAVLGFLKLSLMVLTLAVAFYLALRLDLYKKPLVIVSAILCLIAFLFTFRIVSLPAQNRGFAPFDFMRVNNEQGWQQFFPLVHLLWTWVYFAARAWETGARDWSGLLRAFRERRLLDVEALLVVAILGFLPGEIVRIHGGSAIYFSDVQRWLALSFIIARVGIWISAWKPAPKASLSSVRLSTVLAVFVAAPFVVSMLVNLAQLPGRLARSNVSLRHEIATGMSYQPIVTALRDISRLPRSERRQALLFIPQSNRQYWSMFADDGRCTFTPLIAPGIASVALLDGMPPFGCEVTEQYNMTAYHARTRPQTAADTDDRTLCEKTRAKGFREVIVLEQSSENVPRSRRIDCYLHSS